MRVQFLNFSNNLKSSFYQNTCRNNFVQKNTAASPLKPLLKDTAEISFEGEHCSPDNFRIKKIKNLRCPVCGRIMLNDEQTDEFVEDIASKKGLELVQALEKYEDEEIFTRRKTLQNKSIYRPIEQQAVDIVKNLAEQYQDKNLYELFQIQSSKSLIKLIPIQMEILKEYENYALKNVKDEKHKEKLLKLTAEYEKQINGTSKTRFARKKLIYDSIHVFSNLKEQNEINLIVQKLPASQNNVDAFFVKYAAKAKNSKELAKNFVKQAHSSTEHLQPRSKNGKNNLQNYIADCASCNFERQNKDFDVWMKSIPDFEHNLQNYLEEVQYAIDNELLNDNYSSYVYDIICTIKTLSNGEINLILPKNGQSCGEKRNFKIKKILQN